MPKRIILLCGCLVLLVSLFPGISSKSAAPTETPPAQVYLPIIANDPKPLKSPEWIGPGGGAITDLIYNPRNADEVFAATWGRGIFKSVDGGQNWRNASLGLDNLDVNVIEVSPQNPLILFAGTYRGGVYKSVNGGESWYRSDAGIQEDAITYAIEIDPKHTQRIYLATRGKSNNGGPPWNGIVYKSEDGGQSWQPVLTDVGGSGQEDWAYDLSIYPRSTNIVYAATHEHGAYRSTNYGQSWQAINNGVYDQTARAIEPDPRPSSGVVFLGVFRPNGLFKSLNNGDSWSLKTNNIRHVRTYRIKINPNEKDTLYLATFGQGIMKSTDHGENWIYAGLGDETILDIDVRPGSYNTLLGATLDNGIFKTKNNGGSWSHSQRGLDASTVTSVVTQAGSSQRLFASLYPGWIVRSLDGGLTWTDYHENIPDKRIHALVAHPYNPYLLYALTDGLGLYRRDTQSENSWHPIGSNLPANLLQTTQPSQHPFHQTDIFERLFPDETSNALLNVPLSTNVPMISMAFSDTNPAVAYLGTSGSGVYRSIDDGIRWAAAGLNGVSIYHLVVVPGEPNRVYAATNAEDTIQVSLDGGSHWTGTHLTGVTAYSLSIPPTEPEILFAGTSKGVYRYTSGNWVFSGLGDSTITSVAAHPTEPGMIMAGTLDGAFITTDGGQSWSAWPPEIKGFEVQNIAFDPNDPGIVYFATKLHGILKAYP